MRMAAVALTLELSHQCLELVAAVFEVAELIVARARRREEDSVARACQLARLRDGGGQIATSRDGCEVAQLLGDARRILADGEQRPDAPFEQRAQRTVRSPLAAASHDEE